jgi:hypothetical protein
MLLLMYNGYVKCRRYVVFRLITNLFRAQAI